MQNYEWYSTLIKPEWAPPSWVFGPVWTVLYIIIAITFGMVALHYFKQKDLPFIVLLPFILNIIFNVIFTPIQFGLQNLPLASIDILLVLGTLIWALISVYKYLPAVSYWNLPYLAWVLFATAVQLTITWLNK
jgi:tryptophan-rich sensory protein